MNIFKKRDQSSLDLTSNSEDFTHVIAVDYLSNNKKITQYFF